MTISRQTEKAILAIAAFAALGGIASWFYLDSATLRSPPVASAPSTTPPIAAVAAPVRVESVAQVAAPVPTAPTAQENPSVPAPTSVPADPPPPAHATSTDRSPVAPTEANVGSSGSTQKSPPPKPVTAADPAQEPVTSNEDGGRQDKAIDLFAERIATLEQDSSEDPSEDPNNATDARLLKEFNARADDEASSSQRMQILHDHLIAWIGSFPADRAGHFTLVSVECRSGACQLLIAEEKPDSSGDASFESSFLALLNEDWCTQLGLHFQGMSTRQAGQPVDGTIEYVLRIIYLGDAASG